MNHTSPGGASRTKHDVVSILSVRSILISKNNDYQYGVIKDDEVLYTPRTGQALGRDTYDAGNMQ